MGNNGDILPVGLFHASMRELYALDRFDFGLKRSFLFSLLGGGVESRPAC
jgi:hypothetical protein